MVNFPKIYTPTRIIAHTEGFSPRLASWDSKEHPDQIRLRTYLDDLRLRIGDLPDRRDLFLKLSVDVGNEEKLFRHHDVENYLTPLFGKNWFDHRQFPLVIGTKHVGSGSSLTIGVAVQTSTECLDRSWRHLSMNAGKSPTSKSWKEGINRFVADAKPTLIPPSQQVEFHMTFRCSTRRNWVWLWKPAGDALSPILGYVGNNKYNPHDDRINSLSLHRLDDDSVANDVHVGFWWRSLRMRIAVFKNDDNAYQQWHRDNRDGFVFNHFGSAKSEYNVLHKSNCSFLWREKDDGSRTVVEKWCTTTERDLVERANECRGDSGWIRCSACFPD